MAFNRQIQLLIGENKGLNLVISDLNVSFDIIRNYKSESNTATFTIYNAKKETRDKIIQKDNNIILKAGYEDEGIGIIFSGLVFEGSSKRQGTEWITEIIAIDYGKNITNIFKQTVSFSYKEGISITTVINDIIAILNISVSGLENASQIILNNAKIFSGTLKNVIKNITNILKVNGVGLYFDNNEMIIYNLGEQNTKFGIINITPTSGLLGSPEEIIDNSDVNKKKRYNLTSLMNSKIRPNALINLKSENINGLFIVEQVNFQGDNFGGDFNCQLEVSE
jgi:hypothetical protein